ncbi:MAG: hypothetical protein KGL68_17880 [Burkholderiales bacterium]|nr:hypothetical protein [Burkholderiales bacterium]
MIPRRFLLAFALAATAAGVQAQVPDEAAQRERIRVEREAAGKRFDEAQKACRSKFAVNDCVDQARRERDDVLSGLKRQERVLDDAERMRRAAERQKALDERRSPERQQEEAQRRAKALADQKSRDARAAAKGAGRTPDGRPAPQGTPRGPVSPGSHGISPEEAAKNRAEYEQRMREAQQHKAEVEARNAKRTQPPAAPLPTPPRTGASGS